MSASKESAFDNCDNGVVGGCDECQKCDPEFDTKKEAQTIDGLRSYCDDLIAQRDEAISARNLAQAGIHEMLEAMQKAKIDNQVMQKVLTELLNLLRSAEANCRNMSDRLALFGFTGVSYVDIVSAQVKMAIRLLEGEQ